MESLLCCDKDGLIFGVLEALGQVLKVAKAAGSSQEEPQDQDSCGGEGNQRLILGPRLCILPYLGRPWLCERAREVRSENICQMCGCKHVCDCVCVVVIVLCGIWMYV